MGFETIGKYEIRGQLGAGAMGQVLDAFDPVIERRAALKLLPRPDAADPEGAENLARFKREAQAAGRLTHPNIVAVYDYGEDASHAWIAMELVEGGTLKQRLDGGQRLPLPTIARVMEQVLAALDYSHRRGVIHRDIKPANIMLTEDGTAKIADFGIARIENSSMTQLGTVMGTPAYMAPEQLRGEALDSRADIWACGVLLYQLLTGEKPFEGGFSAVLHKAIHTEPPPPSSLSVTAPRGMDAVVARALAKRPGDRFATAAEFAAALHAATSPEADATIVMPARDPAHPPAAPRRTKLLLGGGAALAAAGAAAFFLLAPREAGSPNPGTNAVASVEQLPQAPLPAPPGPAPREQALLAPEPPALPVWSPPPVPPSPLPPPRPAAPAPQVVALAPPPRPDFRAAAAAAAGLPCGLLAAQPGEDGLALEGVVRTADAPALRQALAAHDIPPAAARLAVQVFDGPYCAALDLLRPALAAVGAAPRAALVGEAPLHAGDLLRFEVAMPEWPGLLHVAYIMRSGEVAHLVPGAAHQAGATIRLGEPRPGFPGWEVSEPFGTDMLLAIVSDGPLFSGARPQLEPQEAFLAALGQALRTARQAGRRVAARPLVVETAPR